MLIGSPPAGWTFTAIWWDGDDADADGARDKRRLVDGQAVLGRLRRDKQHDLTPLSEHGMK